MKEIKVFDQVANGEKQVSIPASVISAYLRCRRNGNELLNFDDCLWEETIPLISTALLENDITEFTISSTFSSLISVLALFDAQGWKMSGIVTVNAAYKSFMSNDWERIPAIMMVHKEV